MSASSQPDIMKQRLFYAILSCLVFFTQGKECAVSARNLPDQVGLLQTLCKEGAHLVVADASRSKIKLENLISLEVSSLPSLHKPRFLLDEQISKKVQGQARPLQAWQGTEDPAIDEELGGAPMASWDQFQVNADKFGVSSTYDESFYTTAKVNPADLTERQRRRAEAVTKELEGKPADDELLEGEDEEQRFGAVLGTGRFTAPARRKQRKFPRRRRADKLPVTQAYFQEWAQSEFTGKVSVDW